MTTIHHEVDCGVVARWAEPLPPDQAGICAECGEHHEPAVECPECGQLASTVTGMLATVIETSAGRRRLVISRRGPSGSWTPCRVVAATEETVRMLRRAAIHSERHLAEQTQRGALA